MADREHDRRDQRAVLLVGPGARAREAGAVLAVLSSLDPAGERRLAPLPDAAVADLEELLAQRASEGLLILESGRVPLEDIGFVRRFLERHGGWRLAVVGEDENEPRARALLALVRAQWLVWPPDLERLRELLPASAAVAEPGRGRGRRAAPRASPAANGGVDLDELLEELLAGAALRGDGSARYHLVPRPGCRVARDRGVLLEGLQGLIELARVCAGADGMVRATLAGSAAEAQVQLDFPRASLPEKELAALLDVPADGVEAPLALALAAARHGAEVLRELGGQVELVSGGPGRVRCEVRLPARASPLEAARAGKPEDPFA